MKRVLLALVALVTLATMLYIGVYTGLVPAARLDGVALQKTLREDLTEELGTTISVLCPRDELQQKNRIVDCEARRIDTGARSGIRVTQDDHRGHYRFEVLDLDRLAAGPTPEVRQEAAAPTAVVDEEACPRAAASMLQLVGSRPASGVEVLDLPHGRTSAAPGGVILIAQIDAADEYGVRDARLGQWFVGDDGSVLSFDESAAGFTAWAMHDFEGITTGTTMAAAYCAEQTTLVP